MNAARTRDLEATRRAILEAAGEVILAKGVGQTAMREVAGRAGVTSSLIHHHFGSRDGLRLAEKVRPSSAYATEQMELLKNREPSAELVRDSTKMYFRFLRTNPEVVKMLAWLLVEETQDEGCADLEEAVKIFVEGVLLRPGA
jgi:TetR/AcrR family transcriptional regulator